MTSAELRGYQIQLFVSNSNLVNFNLGIFNSAYICYHNRVEVAQIFPNVSFTKTSLTKKEGKEKKKKGRQTGCQGTYGAERATPKKPLPNHEGR